MSARSKDTTIDTLALFRNTLYNKNFYTCDFYTRKPWNKETLYTI